MSTYVSKTPRIGDLNDINKKAKKQEEIITKQRMAK